MRRTSKTREVHELNLFQSAALCTISRRVINTGRKPTATEKPGGRELSDPSDYRHLRTAKRLTTHTTTEYPGANHRIINEAPVANGPCIGKLTTVHKSYSKDSTSSYSHWQLRSKIEERASLGSVHEFTVNRRGLFLVGTTGLSRPRE
jgi:hypothetical protein